MSAGRAKTKRRRKAPASAGKAAEGAGRRRGEIELRTTVGTYTALGYRAVAVAARDGWGGPSVASGRAHQQYHRKDLQAQSRQFARDNAIYSGLIDRTAAYITGRGFGLQARTRSTSFNRRAEELWRRDHRRPEIHGLLDGLGVERMVATELLTCGETAAILAREEGRLQLIEPEQIDHRTHADGVETDAQGTPVRYHVCPYGRGGMPETAKATGYQPGRELLYLGSLRRPSDIRAVPPLEASFPMLHRINDVCDSEAIAWQILSRIAVSVTRPFGSSIGYGESREDPNKAATEADGDLANRLVDLDYALIYQGSPGDKVEGIERNIPGMQFSESLRMFLRLLGLPLGLPLEIVLLDWTRSNYSQSRAVLEQAYQAFLRWQDLLEGFLYRPWYEWSVDRWIAAKELPARADAHEHGWIRPTFPWIDQLKEAQAWAAKLDRGFASHGAVLKSLGMDREELLAQREREIREAIQIARRISDEEGRLVPWEPLAGLRPFNLPARGRPAGGEPNNPATPPPTEGTR